MSGDYKIEDDGISGKFEPIPCHVFVTESTFGLPVYNWKPQQEIFTGIRNWILQNRRAGKNSVLLAYSLGKAQRLLAGLRDFAPDIYVHTAIWNAQQALKATGIPFPEVIQVNPGPARNKYEGAVIIAPPGSDGSPWINRFSPYAVGVCSGWMQVRGFFRRRNVDAGFALSDHADWSGLLQAVEATGAQKIYVTHGFQAVLARFLTERGKQAEEVITQYGEEESSPEGEQEKS
jgi:putative mRNA 3-end processing factor